MATESAVDLIYKPLRTSGEGNAQVYWGKITPLAGASADIYRVMKIPAGLIVTLVQLINADLDSNATPTITFKMGYNHIDGSTGDDDDAFVASGDTSLQSANAGKFFHIKHIEVKRDSYLEIVLTAAAATFASGDIHVAIYGDGIGAT